MQRFEHDMVSIRQGRHEAWLIDTTPRMVSLRLTPHSATQL